MQQPLAVESYFLEFDVVITTWDSYSSLRSGDKWREVIETTNMNADRRAVIKRILKHLWKPFTLQDVKQKKRKTLFPDRIKCQHTSLNTSKCTNRQTDSGSLHTSPVIMLEGYQQTHTVNHLTLPLRARAADLQMLNIMQAAAAVHRICATGKKEVKSRKHEAREETRKKKKIRAVKESRKLYQFKNNKPTYGSFPFFKRRVSKGNHKQKKWIRGPGQGGMGNTRAQPVKVHSKTDEEDLK